MDIYEEMLDLKLKGYCCSQIIMEMGLSRLNKENKDLIDAMAGLCEGAWSGKACGALTAAICLLYLAEPKAASQSLVRDFSDWFEACYETAECGEIIEGNPLAKAEKCPMIIENSFKKVCELLEWD